MSEAIVMSCVGNDQGCPCQDGDACHYRDIPGSPGWPIPLPEQIRAESADRDREALLAAHATLSGLGEGKFDE